MNARFRRFSKLVRRTTTYLLPWPLCCLCCCRRYGNALFLKTTNSDMCTFQKTTVVTETSSMTRHRSATSSRTEEHHILVCQICSHPLRCSVPRRITISSKLGVAWVKALKHIVPVARGTNVTWWSRLEGPERTGWRETYLWDGVVLRILQQFCAGSQTDGVVGARACRCLHSCSCKLLNRLTRGMPLFSRTDVVTLGMYTELWMT
jgi:hypothetical protein